MKVLQAIIHELFARSIAGVFALADGDDLKVKVRPRSSWVLNAGLATRLAHAPIQPVARPLRDHDVQTIEDLTGTYERLDPEHYDTATTDHLLAELYRHGGEATWVLGLFRPRKYRGHWSGLCWQGRPTACAGLACYALAHISQRVLEARREQTQADTSVSDDLQPLFGLALRNAGQSPSRTYMAGLCAVAAIRAGTHGEDADPTMWPMDGGDGGLAEFVKID